MPQWLTIVLALGGSAIISAFFGYIIKRILDKYFERKDREAIMAAEQLKEAQKLKEEKLRKERREDLNEIIEAKLIPLNQKMDAMDKNLATNSCGTVTMLRDRMKCSLNYCRKQGFASAGDKANWHELYNSYKDLGGNHFKEYVDQWKDEIDGLPLEKISKRKKEK